MTDEELDEIKYRLSERGIFAADVHALIAEVERLREPPTCGCGAPEEEHWQPPDEYEFWRSTFSPTLHSVRYQRDRPKDPLAKRCFVTPSEEGYQQWLNNNPEWTPNDD